MLSCAVVLAVVAAAQALPFAPIAPIAPIPFPSSTATGAASGQVNAGQSVDAFGNVSNIKQHGSQANGQVHGFGAQNFGNAFTQQQQQQNLFGNADRTQTGAVSNQNTNGGGLLPGLPVIPHFPLLNPSASGNAQGVVTSGETFGIDGSKSVIQSVGSSAGGSAANGGLSDNRANAGTSSTTGLLGTSSQTNTNAQSTQVTGR